MAERYPFTVQVDGEEYTCHRIVTGSRKLSQEIVVAGKGSKHDSAFYGADWHPLSSMEGIARTIAREIISES